MTSSDAGVTSSSIISLIVPLPMPTLSPAPSLTLSPVSTTNDNLIHRPFAGDLLRAKFTEPDIVKACHEGYVNHNSNWSPQDCIRQTSFEILGHEISAEANCAAGILRLGNLPMFRMPVHSDCASGGIFAIPAFKMLCPRYGGRVERP